MEYLDNMIRGFAILILLLLFILFAIVYATRKRDKRMERKIDLLLIANGLRAKLEEIDKADGRETTAGLF